LTHDDGQSAEWFDARERDEEPPSEAARVEECAFTDADAPFAAVEAEWFNLARGSRHLAIELELETTSLLRCGRFGALIAGGKWLDSHPGTTAETASDGFLLGAARVASAETGVHQRV
jgi:hypothetical protein